MMFIFKVAWRYMFSNISQTLLLVAGVAVGALAFVYITTLVNGLRDRQITLTTSNIAHIVFEMPDKNPTPHIKTDSDTTLLSVTQLDTGTRPQIRNWSGIVTVLDHTPGIVAVSPEISANGFIVRAQTVKPVSISGIKTERLNAIVNLAANMTDGIARIDGASAVLGYDLAHDLGIGVGQTIRIRSDRQVEQLLTVRGIVKTGAFGADKRAVYTNFDRARAFAALPYGITEINVRVADPFNSTPIAHRLADVTGLKATDWIESNPRLSDALSAQRNSAKIIQSFSMVTVLVGVASALLLNAMRRRGEIGIMRAMGLTRGFITAVFVVQGGLIGLVGSATGAILGYRLTTYFATAWVRSDGSPLLPIDPSQGYYTQLIIMITVGAMIAALLPARMASKIDPVEAIGG